MKKSILIVMVCTIFLIACSEKPKTYTREEFKESKQLTLEIVKWCDEHPDEGKTANCNNARQINYSLCNEFKKACGKSWQ